MSKCLRCGAGNEWIEPVAKEAKKPRRKRPKVRYVQFYTGFDSAGYMVCRKDYDGVLNRHLCDCDTESSAKRIAAALNLYEAVRRGEM